MDGDDDDDDASSPREEDAKEKVEDTEERKTLEKWRHSSLHPEETRASRWASKLLFNAEVVTTNTMKKDPEHFQNYSNALELNRRKQLWKRYRKSRRIYREVDTRSRSAG